MKEIFIDSRNQNIWNKIQSKFQIGFEDSLDENYGCYCQNDNVIFYINKNNLCIDSFTHEMLHVYLRLREFYFGGALQMNLGYDSIFSQIFSANLIEHIGNCLDHVKMLSLYIDLGFERRKFISDYDLFKCTDLEILNLQRFYKVNNAVNSKLAGTYIGKLVSIFADPNDSFDYSTHLSELQKIDPHLYKIVEDLFDQTKSIKIENRLSYENSYSTVVFNFKENLQTWIEQINLTN